MRDAPNFLIPHGRLSNKKQIEIEEREKPITIKEPKNEYWN
jgi:hypothetical protein